eukprot:TRINITY_DN14086_c0_g3_i1.p1 TRINITY_DN14086_c0_g3~~TRINITY_DN14086_c0_g3_i1.p1  ORF type:complete len:239 (+),score=48.21 TRINITY_DN14086_c0_g3_i1:60-719(+)
MALHRRGGSATARLFVAAAALLSLAFRPCAAQSNASLFGAQGDSRVYVAKPAAWNVYLPNFGRPKLSYSTPLDRESYNLQPSFYGRVVMEPGANVTRSLGCEPLAAAAPPGGGVALLLERGRCRFSVKVANVFRAGYAAALVANTVPGADQVPDMEAGTDLDEKVDIPAWALSLEDGIDLRSWLASDHSIRVEIADVPRRDHLGLFQEDSDGLRLYSVV